MIVIEQEKLMSGYVRQYCQSEFPSALMKFFINWYTIEFVHVVSPYNDALDCKIGLDVTLNVVWGA